ncbi:MAG: nitrogenase stabilizing/protective protein NifW [Burkholderiales bacterium]|nr:nitrogenase stabilizing/protective protein NifW [Burkholderiales bacterium]
MDNLIQRLKALSSAEDFLQFFGIPYEESIVHVNRLHILKRFYQYLHRSSGLADLGEVEMFRAYRELLLQAYGDFVTSTPAQEKVFKVFQDSEGRQHVSLSRLRDSLDDKRRAAAA